MLMKTVVTHNGSFHPDDVFAVATLQLVFGVENLEIIRSRNEEDFARADIVVDVGMIYDPEKSRFDHHQTDGPVRENGLLYAAFGLVWKEFGEQLCGSNEVSNKIDERIVQPIDAGDNGVTLFELNSIEVSPIEIQDVIFSYHPVGDIANEEFDVNFMLAVDFARNYLARKIAKAVYSETQKKKAEKIYELSADKSLIVIEEHISKSCFIKFEDVLVTVSPLNDDEGRWKATTLPIDKKNMFTHRVLFPSSWAGLEKEELQKESSLEGLDFCHRSRHFLVAKTKEGAIAAAEAAIKNGAE